MLSAKRLMQAWPFRGCRLLPSFVGKTAASAFAFLSLGDIRSPGLRPSCSCSLIQPISAGRLMQAWPFRGCRLLPSFVGKTAASAFAFLSLGDIRSPGLRPSCSCSLIQPISAGRLMQAWPFRGCRLDFPNKKCPCRGTIDVLLQGRIYKNPIPVVPPCFAVAAHSRRNTNIFPATNVCPHVMKYCAFRRFLMPSVVHLRISVLPGFHLPGLSGSAPSALSPLQRFTFMKLVLLYAYFCGLSRNFRIFPIIIYFRNVF